MDWIMDLILDLILDWKAESTNSTHVSRPSHRSHFDHLQSCAKGFDYEDSYGFLSMQRLRS